MYCQIYIFQIVIVSESYTLYKEKGYKDSKASFANHVLILNLAVSDFLMGIYLLCLSIVDTMYSGIYCLESVKWLASTTCKSLGVIVVVSCQASVLFLASLSTVRLITVLNVSSLVIESSTRNKCSMKANNHISCILKGHNIKLLGNSS